MFERYGSAVARTALSQSHERGVGGRPLHIECLSCKLSGLWHWEPSNPQIWHHSGVSMEKDLDISTILSLRIASTIVTYPPCQPCLPFTTSARTATGRCKVPLILSRHKREPYINILSIENLSGSCLRLGNPRL